MTEVDLTLYAIVDPERTAGRDVAACAAAAVAGGATLIQYRDKHAETGVFVERARAILVALAGSGVPCLINDRVDVALAAGADGVHIGQEDMAPSDARRLLGRDAIVGLTVKSEDDARTVPVDLVDYVCIGGVFATASKVNRAPPVGLAGFAARAAIVRALRPGLPVGAIAGIGRDNAADVIAAGADGIAVISEMFMQDDIEAAARALRAIVDDGLKAREAVS